MKSKSEINKMIIDTIDKLCNDENIRLLIEQSLQYELDNWSRIQINSKIEEDYKIILDRISKEMIK